MVALALAYWRLKDNSSRYESLEILYSFIKCFAISYGSESLYNAILTGLLDEPIPISTNIIGNSGGSSFKGSVFYYC